jgi:hypothetical protein
MMIQGTKGKQYSKSGYRKVVQVRFLFRHQKQSKSITENDLRIILDLPQFFSFCKVINAKFLSERIGMSAQIRIPAAFEVFLGTNYLETLEKQLCLSIPICF